MRTTSMETEANAFVEVAELDVVVALGAEPPLSSEQRRRLMRTPGLQVRGGAGGTVLVRGTPLRLRQAALRREMDWLPVTCRRTLLAAANAGVVRIYMHDREGQRALDELVRAHNARMDSEWRVKEMVRVNDRHPDLPPSYEAQLRVCHGLLRTMQQVARAEFGAGIAAPVRALSRALDYQP